MSSDTRSSGSVSAQPDLDLLARSLGLQLSQEEKEAFEAFGPLVAESLGAVSAAECASIPATPPSRSWSAPNEEEDTLNAWVAKTRIEGTGTGPLRGKTVVLKDNILLAGLPFFNGQRMMEGYIADTDATVVTRILEAGGIIAGKAHCEPLCVGGGSHLNLMGPVHNPYRKGYSSGGSSSGVAALVAAGEVDFGIGADQGGSIRIPAAQCGIVGLKPTYGLIPYTGAVPMEITLDHLGPMTRTVEQNAILLDVLAGADGVDPRQRIPSTRMSAYPFRKSVTGLRVGILKEGFALANLDSRIAALARSAAMQLEKSGASVSEVSVPQHPLGGALFFVIAVMGFISTVMDGDSIGVGRSDSFLVHHARFHRRWREHVNEFSPFIKFLLLWGRHLVSQQGNIPYGVAQNCVPAFRAAYDNALQQFDVLLMPTSAILPQPHPPPGSSTLLLLQRSIEMIGNTSQFDVTGHPALSVPCGFIDDLPVGVQLVGRRFEEQLLYQAAAAIEAANAQ
jgi:amidase